MDKESLLKYQKHHSFSDLTKVTNRDHFMECPLDWSVIVTDIKGSTLAVQNGKYREVNIGGASVIALISEKMTTRDFPFVFGGDGATVLLPHSVVTSLLNDFSNLIEKIKKDFALELRIGIVPYKELKTHGHLVWIGKLKLSSTNSLAQLTGSGMDYAEQWVKTKTDYLVKGSSSSAFQGLSKLSCRFAPIRSRNGKILTLTIKPLVATDTPEFHRMIAALGHYFTDKVYRPISKTDLRMDSFFKVLKKESRIQGFSLNTIRHVIIVWFVVRLSKWVSLGEISNVVDAYLNHVPDNSDYVKFDGSLRSVIDCSEKDIQFILSQLDNYQTLNIIDYGHHISANAVMTCLVDEIRDQKHIHFIDGEGGGYTSASAMIKGRKLTKVVV